MNVCFEFGVLFRSYIVFALVYSAGCCILLSIQAHAIFLANQNTKQYVRNKPYKSLHGHVTVVSMHGHNNMLHNIS